MPTPQQIVDSAIKAHEQRYHTRPTKANRGKVKPYSVEYNKFWAVFPKRYIKRSNSWVKRGKYDGWEVWQNMTEEEQGLALALVVNEKAAEATQDVHRWLKGRRWEDYIAKPPFEPTEGLPTPDMRTVEDKKESVSDKVNRQRKKLGVK